ncbi:MAG: acetylornithine deacetylase [Pseudomonadota bacterium]
MPEPAQLEATLTHLSQLISYPSVSSESNLDVIGYLDEQLRRIGARTVITTSEDGRKANVFATLGPDADGGVVLSGHTDVVPTTGQAWTSDPFAARIDDGRVYGRGSCDMKGFLAAALAMGPHYASRQLRKPVHFAFTYDEETGCLGAPVLIDELMRTGPRPSVAIIGEPTSMRMIEGHKGCYEFTTHVCGLEGHASLPDQGVNAIEYAVRYLHRLLELGADLRDRVPPGSPFDPPWPTLSVGQIEGGIARNVIAKDCRIEWEMRPLKQSDADYVMERIDAYARDQLLPAMRAVYADADIQTETFAAVVGLDPEPDSKAIELVGALTGSNTTDVVSFGTEAGLFQAAGISTVVCGPGSIEQAHRPDEFVDISQLEACLAMLERLTVRLEA